MNIQAKRDFLHFMRKAMVIRNYATKTTSTYIAVLKKYFSQLEKPLDSVTLDDILKWQYHLVHVDQVSWSHFNKMVCALRFYSASQNPPQLAAGMKALYSSRLDRNLSEHRFSELAPGSLFSESTRC